MQKLSKRVKYNTSQDSQGDEVIKIDQAEMKAYLDQMVEFQKQMDNSEQEETSENYIECAYDKYAKLETRKERRKALVDGEDKDEARERAMM